MKNLKTLFLLSLALFAQSMAFANDNTSSSAMEEIDAILQSSFADYTIAEDTEVLITFILSAESELLVFSTSDETLDSKIKSALNYKTIAATDLTKGQQYVLPLRLEK